MRRASLFTVFVTVFLDLVGFGLVVPYLPGVARDLGASDLVAALVGASYSLMQFIFVPLWGSLSDRVGRRPVLMVSIGATSLAMLSLAFSTSLWMIFAARIASGIATANIAVAQAYIADVTTREERGRGMALVGVAIGLGFVLGPVIGGALSALGSSSRPGESPALSAAGLSAVNFLLAAFWLPESLPKEKRGKTNEGGKRRVRMGAIRAAFAKPGMTAAIVVNLSVVLFFAGLEQTFRLYTEDAFSMSERQTGYVLGCSGLVLILAQGAIIPVLARRLAARTLIVIGLVIEAVGFGVVSLAPPYAPVLYAGMATISLGTAFVNPNLAAYVSRLGSSHDQGSLLGVLQSSGAFARVCGPLVAGLSYQFAGPRAPYVSAAIAAALVTIAALRLTTTTQEADDSGGK